MKPRSGLWTLGAAALAAIMAVTMIAEVSAAPKAAKNAAPAMEEDGEMADVPANQAPLDAGNADEELPAARPAPPKFGPPAPVTLSAVLSEGGAAIDTDIVWRVFQGFPDADGHYKLLKTAREAQPTFLLPPGEYLVNVAYGRASLTKKLAIWPQNPVKEEFVVNAGGLRLTATVAHGTIQGDNLVKFDIYAEAQDQNGNRVKVLSDMKPGIVIRLNSGIYYLVSNFGDVNSTIASDVVVEPGKITEAVIDHDAGRVTFKLVQRAGGEAVADTRWAIYTASNDLLKESGGAFVSHFLAAGDYRVVAQHHDNQYVSTFHISPGENKVVEVVME